MNQQVQSVNLNDTIEAVRLQLGEPIKESDYLGYKVLWYSSRDPFEGNLLYFEDNTLKLITNGVEDKTLKDYIDVHGIPQVSHSYYSGNLQRADNKDITVHIWPNAGIDVVSYGNIEQSEVILERNYLPTDLAGYFSSVGKMFQGNEEVTVNYEFTPQTLKNVKDITIESEANVSRSQIFFEYANANIPLLVGSFITITLLVVALTIAWKKYKKTPNIV